MEKRKWNSRKWEKIGLQEPLISLANLLDPTRSDPTRPSFETMVRTFAPLDSYWLFYFQNYLSLIN